MSDEIKILAIDDDELTLTVLRKILEAEHYVAETAASAREALAKLRDNRYDAVLCDIWMPGMMGREFYEQLRTDFPGSEKRVIFITADVASEATWNFIDGQNLPYVLKPFNRAELVKQLTKVIGKSPAVPRLEPVVWDGANRRRRRRITMNAKIKVNRKDQYSESAQIATMVDASSMGVTFLSERKYSIGSELLVTYPYTDAGGLTQTGLVVRVEAMENGFWRVSIAF